MCRIPRTFSFTIPVTNYFPNREKMKHGKNENGQNPKIHGENLEPSPKVADKIKSATMSNVNKDILFLVKEIFPNDRRKDRQKVLMFFGKFTNRQKRPDWITNQWKLYWSNTKPYPQTSWNL